MPSVQPDNPLERQRLQLQARIRRHIRIDPITGCWRWTGQTKGAPGSTARYPRITMRMPGYLHPRPMIATRVSLWVFVGPPPSPDHEAAHDPERCPHTDCVNYAHLRWASRKENEADKRHPRRLHLREIFPPTHRVLDEEPEDSVPF